MSVYNKASLVQIPSGYKSGTLYNVLPNTADGDFDFTRGSTATRVNQNGLIETVASGVPRLDYPLLDGVVQDCPALLLEPQRSNLTLYSEDLSNSYWYKQNGSITSNVITSPSGSQDADLFSENTSAGDHAIFDIVNYFVAGTTYTTSFYAKANGRTKIELTSANSNTCPTGRFDLVSVSATATNTSFNAKIENAGNGWFRCSVSRVAPNNGLDLPYYAMVQTFGIIGYQGDGTSGMYFWGMQTEDNAGYATSYIPTSGSAVTRSADVCNGAGTSSLFNDSEGVLFTEIQADAVHSLNKSISLSDGSGNNRIFLRESSGTLYLYVFSGGASQVAVSTTELNVAEMNKICAKYKANDFSLWVNGYELATDTSGITPTGLSEVSFTEGGATENYYGKSKQVITFNEALSDTELEALTSWTSFSEMATEQLYTIE